MPYKLLLGGYRSTFAVISFDDSPARIKLVKESPAPENPSWIEPSASAAQKSTDGSQILYSLSEGEDGLAFGLELKGDEVTVTQKRKTNGGPAHGKPFYPV